MPDIFSQEVPELLQRHLEHLKSSAISLDVIKERGYRSVLKCRDKMAGDDTPYGPGEMSLGALGFKQMQLRLPAILMPLHGVDGGIVLHQLRPDDPRHAQDNDKPIKYETPQRRGLRLDAPPRCFKGLGDPSVPLFITEGIKKADSLATAGACVITLLGVWGWRGTNEYGGKALLADFDLIALNGRTVYLTFDSDIIVKEQVKLALDRFSRVLINKKAIVKTVHLPPGADNAKTGVDDYLAQGYTLQDVLALATDSTGPASKPKAVIDSRKLPFAGNYTVKDGCHCRLQYNQKTEDYDTIPLCSFTAEITDEFLTDNGAELRRWIRISGKTCSGHPLPPVDIEGTKFDAMNWLTEKWGTDASLVPGNMIKEHVRAAILANSPLIAKKHMYTHTGWLDIDGSRVFLTEEGALGGGSIMVDQDPRLKDYRITKPDMDAAEAFRGSLEFLDVSSKDSTVPLWAAMYLAPLTSVLEPTFTLWCIGPSGTFKSTISALALCHYGNFNYKRLPTSWDTTANRLEYLLFLAKDVPVVVDDYAPAPDVNSQRQLDALVNRTVRNMGNRQTRGRLHSAGVAQADYFPRALLISSGEQLPGGHSISARYFQVPFAKNWVDLKILTKEQSNTTSYRGAMYYYLSWLRENWKEVTGPLKAQWEQLRNRAREEQPEGNHSRLPEEVAMLYLGLMTGIRAAVHYGAIAQEKADELLVESWKILVRISAEQGRMIEMERPAEKFLEALRSLISSKKVIFKDKTEQNSSPPPPGQTFIGWTDQMEHPELLYLIAGVAYNIVHDYYSHSGQALTINQRAVYEDLLRQGHLVINNSPGDRHSTSSLIRLSSGDVERVVPLKRESVDAQVKTFAELGGGG